MADKVEVLAVLSRAFGAAEVHYDDLATGGEAYTSGGPNAVARRDRYMKEHRQVRDLVAYMIATLEEIARVGDGHGPHTPPTNYAGTTGEGHATCRGLAEEALSTLAGAGQ